MPEGCKGQEDAREKSKKVDEDPQREGRLVAEGWTAKTEEISSGALKEKLDG